MRDSSVQALCAHGVRLYDEAEDEPLGNGTSNTGPDASRAIRSATLPSMSRCTPRRPWVPSTTRSAIQRAASSAIASATCRVGAPVSMSTASASTPALLAASFAAATIVAPALRRAARIPSKQCSQRIDKPAIVFGQCRGDAHIARAERRVVGVVVAARYLGPSGRDRVVDRRQRVFAQQQLDALKCAASLLRDGAHDRPLAPLRRPAPRPHPAPTGRCAQRSNAARWRCCDAS